MMLVTPQTSAEGKEVHKVLISENVYYDGPSKPEEFYMSVLTSSIDLAIFTPPPLPRPPA